MTVLAVQVGRGVARIDRVDPHCGQELRILEGEHDDRSLRGRVPEDVFPDSMRSGSVTKRGKPKPLATLTITGLVDAVGSGRAAFVTRTIEQTVVSNTVARSSAEKSSTPAFGSVMPASLMSTSSAGTAASAAVTDAPSVTSNWMTWAQHPSPQVLGSLARALRLTDDEWDHLFRMGGVAVPTKTMVPRHVTPGVQHSVDRLGEVPVAVFSAG